MPMSDSFQTRLFPLLPAIIRKFGNSFHIYDESGIRQTVRQTYQAFEGIGLLFKEFFAVKALPKPAIMLIMNEERCGFDCSSIPELRLARNARAKPDQIMFTSNNTSSEEFLEAARHGGCILNLDDVSLIRKVPDPFPELICFRLNPGGLKSGDEVNQIIGEPRDSKYGVPVEDIVDAYSWAKARGAKRFGLHTMVCSNDRDYRHLVATNKILFDVAAQLSRTLGIEFEFLNMGGGIGIPYRPDDEEFDMNGLAEGCRELVNRFNDEFHYAPMLCMESGRYMTGPHGVFVNVVQNVYKKYKHIIGVPTAMPGLMRVGMYSSAYHHCTLLDKRGELVTGPTRPTTVAGPICENCDVLAKSIGLPAAKEGDIVVTHDTGAHGSAMGFNYNGRCRPQELLLCEDGSVRRICRAETYEDLDARHTGLYGLAHVMSAKQLAIA